jgi:LysR family hydrogen peroxide-inducible transcriptional activator
MPSLTQLEYMLAVDKHRHFGRAADACHVSQPSLSMQLQKLEEELGVVVFDRSKKPILPTPKGAVLIEQAKQVIAEHRRLIELSQVQHGVLRGDLRLGVIPTLAPYLIPLFIEKFAKSYPEVNLQIAEMKTAEILQALDEDRLDAGLLVTPIGQARFEEKVLFYEPFYLYVSDGHPYHKKSRVRESDLNATDIWLLEEGHCMRNQVVRLCSLKKDSGVFKNVRFESGNLETLRSLVDHSEGYTLLPHLAVHEITDAVSKKKIKPFIRPVPTREVSLIHRRKHLNAELLKELADTIVKSVPKRLFEIQQNEIEIVEI